MACAIESVNIFEEANWKKLDQNKNYSQVSISVYHMGLIGAVNGPTCFIVKGKKKRKVYMDVLLKRNRA